LAGDISFLAALKVGMRWHQARQRVLAENVANANSAGYRARDLAPLSFESMVRMPGFRATLTTSSTDPRHIGFAGGAAAEADAGFASAPAEGHEVTPDGNGVTLEEQMMKLTANQLDYQAVTTLYARGLGLIRTALKRTT
jgi:flagellar basal-body rod protein FlgB